MPDGEVMGCHIVYNSALSEGNVRITPFPRIWKERFQRFRQKDFHEPCKSCVFLSACQGGCWAERMLSDGCLKGVWNHPDNRVEQ
jgi:radical SAM protein with 4Fe4S-binding SPASM domain